MGIVSLFWMLLFSVSSYASYPYCGYEKAITKMINSRDLLVLCPHSESFSIVDTQTSTVEKYLNQVGFENRNVIFDQNETGFISFKYEDSFVTEIHWFDLIKREFGPVIKLNQKLDIRSIYAKHRANIHLFKNNEQAMATLVGMPNSYSNSLNNEIIIETLDLMTGNTVSAKSATEEHHILGSDCGRVISGSDVAKIKGVNYLIAKNSIYWAKGCSALNLNWDGSDNTQFALVDPISLSVVKTISIAKSVLSKSEYGFHDVLSKDGQVYLLQSEPTQNGQPMLGVNLESGKVVTISNALLTTRL